MLSFLIHLGYFLATVLPILVGVMFYTLAERKVMASIQRRLGPSYVSKMGILQPLADGVKALLKEAIIPRRADIFLFLLAPSLAFGLSVISWLFVPTSYNTQTFIDLPLMLLFVLSISSLGVYGVMLSGWSSNSRYAFLGGIRSAAQMISYEVSLALSLLPLLICAESVNFTEIVKFQELVNWFVIPFWPLAIIFYITSLAETNRTPFDLPEAEAEIVAGYNIEYSGFLFALFMLAEYGNMIFMSYLNVIFFWGGWLSPVSFLTFIPASLILALKVMAYAFLFILVRATLPRLRYDQLMDLGWKIFLPLTLGYLILISGVILF